MSKPAWTTAGFARRVLMSRQRLFLIVEGRILDRVFYDRLLAANATAAKEGYEIYLAEQISLGNNASGGKAAALQLFDTYRRSHRLRQVNNRGENVILFGLDRDFDDICGTKRRSPHVFYTVHADVEAEVFANTNLARALAAALSITQTQADAMLTSGLSAFMSDLAVLWQEWVTLCILATCLRARCHVHPSQPSSINDVQYGSVDAVKAAAARSAVMATAFIKGTGRVKQVEQRIAARYRDGKADLLVKGKWLPSYLHWRVKKYFQGAAIDYGSFEKVILKTALGELDYSAPWASPYHSAVTAILT